MGNAVAASACESGTVTASPALIDLYFNAYDAVFGGDVVTEPDGTTYISTGDIKAEWLRDSSAVARADVDFARTDPAVAQTLRGVIARQARYVLLDPYANAFSENYRVVERKFEADSLLYPIWLAYEYWQQTGDASPFGGTERLAFERILRVLRAEQRHAARSPYRHPSLPNGGRGAPVAFTGMVWSGFRPSDDPCTYGYNVPVNMFAVVVMRQLTTIEQRVYHDERQAENAWGLSVQIQRGIEAQARIDVAGFGTVYAYEVDGLGHRLLMDDANVPSLLAIPHFGYVPASDETYRATRRFVLSGHNPYFYSGSVAQGTGSPHTPPRYVWPLALVMQAFTAVDDAELARVLNFIAASDTGDHVLHESFDADDPQRFTRASFAWPNALYTQLISSLQPKTDTSNVGFAECFNGISTAP